MNNESLIRISVGSLEFVVSGREAFVEAQTQKFLGLLPPDAIARHVGTSTTSLQGVVGSNHSQEPAALATPNGDKAPPSLKEFYSARAATTDVDRVTVLTAYLRDHKGKEEVTEEAPHPLFRELAVLGEQPAKNITHGIWNAASKGRAYLSRVEGKRGAYRLTNAGAALVYNTLPDQAKSKRRNGGP